MSVKTVCCASTIPTMFMTTSCGVPLFTNTVKLDDTWVAESQSSTTPFAERVHSINWLSDFSLYCTTSVLEPEPITNSPFLSGHPTVESTVMIESVVLRGSASFVLYGTVNVPLIVSSDKTSSNISTSDVLIEI